MSNNPYPEPPKLSSAKELMNKSKTADSKHVIAEDITPTLAKTVEAQLLEKTILDPTPSRDEETQSVEEKIELIEEELVTENSEAHYEEEKLPAATEADSKSYGGAWGIIKHTGYLPVIAWAFMTAAVTGATAYFFTPPHSHAWFALTVLGFMMGVIAAVDRKTHLIKNQHTILTAILTVPLSLWVAWNLGIWNILFGVVAALAVFGVFIFLVIKVNFGSGGDIKFAPVPAFALGVINPLMSALWLFYALIITVILLIVNKQKKTSFGEGMAISLPFAILSVWALYALTGLPYMEPTLT